MSEERDASWEPVAIRILKLEAKFAAIKLMLDELETGVTREIERRRVTECQSCSKPDPLGEALNSGDGSYRP